MILLRIYYFFKELQIRKKRKNVKLSVDADFNRELWRLTKTLIGVEPKQPLYCPACFTNNHAKVNLVLRKSKMSVDYELNYQNQHFDLHYKCPRCALGSNVFGIAVPLGHWLFVKSLRAKLGIGRVYVPRDDWKQNKKIKERLKVLGYW